MSYRRTIQLVMIIICFHLVGCNSEVAEKSEESHFLHDMDLDSIDRITVQDAKSKVVMIKNDDKTWSLIEPFQFSCRKSKIEKLLFTFAHNFRVKPIDADDSQLGNFGLILNDTEAAKSDPISVTMASTATGISRQIILGDFDIPEFDSAINVEGSEALARRYAYLPQSKKILLVEESFVNILPYPKNWIVSSLPPIERLKSITRCKGDKIHWKISRASSFAEFIHEYPANQKKYSIKNPEILNFLLKFFYYGEIFQILREGFDEKERQQSDTVTFLVSGFHNEQFIFEIGEKFIHEEKNPAKNLTKPAISFVPEKQWDKNRLRKAYISYRVGPSSTEMKKMTCLVYEEQFSSFLKMK